MISPERRHDVEYLQSIYRKVSPERRREIDAIIQKFTTEPPKVREMRRQLVRAMRDGRSDNVKDINHWVQQHQEYK